MSFPRWCAAVIDVGLGKCCETDLPRSSANRNQQLERQLGRSQRRPTLGGTRASTNRRHPSRRRCLFCRFFSDRRDSTYRGRVAFRGRRLADAGDGIGTWYANDARLGRLAGRTRGPVRHWTPPVAGGGVIFRASRKGGTGRRAKMAAPVGPQRPHRRRPGAGRRKARRWRQRQRRGLLVRATLSFSSESPAVPTPPSASVVVVVVDFV